MQEYRITHPSGHELTVLLSKEDAQRLDATPVETKAVPAPTNKAAAKPANKAR